MTSPGGSGMDYGDDYVAARLSIDVPEGSNAAVRELSDGVERFRTAMEASVRSGADMNRYLEQMADASNRAADAQKNLTNQLAAYQQLQARMGPGSGGPAPSYGVPGGVAQQPWAGVTAGMGGSRPPDPADVYYQLHQGSGTNPREFLNAQQARGGVTTSDSVSLSPASIASLAAVIAARDHQGQQEHAKHQGGPPAPHQQPGQDPYAAFQNRASSGLGLAQSMINEIGGGNGTGFGGMALQGVNALRNHLQKKQAARPSSGAPAGGDDPTGGGNSDSPDGGLSGTLKGLGIAGAGIGAIMGAFKLFQSGGAMIAGDRAIGNQRGGAAGEGFQASLKARGIGMDPTLSTEQGRQIVQAEMSGGYANASGETNLPGLDNFMKNNIKTFNVDPSQSMQLLALTAHGTKLSLDEITNGLTQLKQASAEGVQPLSDLVKNTQQNAAQMVAQGVTPGAAWQNSLTNATMFNNDPILAGSQSAPATQSEIMQMRMYGGPGGTGMKLPPGLGPDPQDMAIWIAENGGTEGPKLEVYKRWATYAHSMARDTTSDARDPKHIRAVGLMLKQAQAAGDPMTRPQAEDLYNKFIYGHETPAQIMDQNKQENKKRTQGERDLHPIDPSTGKTGDGSIDGGPGNPRNPRPQNQSGVSSQTVDRIRSAYGGHDDQIEIMQGGKQVGTLNVHDTDQMKKLSDGTYQWRHKGDKGKGIDLSDTPEGKLNGSYSTDDPNNTDTKGGVNGQAGTSGTTSGYTNDNKGGSANATTMIGLTPEASKLFQIVNPPGMPSANDVSANRGDPGAQKNNPPPTAPVPFR